MAEASHKVKTITFRGRRVPIMLQDVNGPCPLLAIANVLLLRNQLQLPPGVGEVSQGRLVEMVAGLLLDANSLEGGAGVSEEHAASLQQNLADVIGLLPQLCTGIDVNPRFTDTRGFEFTREAAVFDLLDIQLVHGWLVDPQDEATAAAVGSRSYNELVVRLVTALGSSATPKQLTPTASLRGAHQFGAGEGLTPRGSGLGGTGGAPAPAAAAEQQGGPAAGPPQQQPQQQPRINAGMLSAALRDTLHVAAPASAAQREGEGGGGGGGGGVLAGDGSCASSMLSMPTSDSMHSMHSVVNRMLTDIVSDAFTATPTASRSTGQVALPGGTPAGGEEEEATSVLQQPGLVELRLEVAEEEGEGAEGAFQVQPAAAAAAAPAAAAAMAAAASGAGQGAGTPPGQPPAGGSRGGSPGEAAVREALLVQQFLEGSGSQLTYHGLLALHEGLRPNQLAVFFRNNHFNTLYKGPNDQLFILAADEGFQFESDVVWEALDSVDGDTQLVGADFRPFRPHASQQEARERQAAAQDADWAAAAAAAAAAGGDTHDADLALAMQLQAEEEERVRLEQQRRQQQLARQQEEQRRQGQPLPSQRRPSSAESGGSSGAAAAKKKKEKKSSSDCCIQ
ncbi:hypothetical protein CHLNCDRAFT_137880 [Chlorella variabilis]|uniref:MINDY deubiquitinase domain-containing protein n=1 Tax=Chlorella variabilis TaxID=554065 RepID=E1Z4Q9_CHLVA|nr:hypothetical protein CHLNCDRAFT_137880 [Chlorella variabilis]EFN59098.1 hypothetical protein CHLNCDRAFT_137880 [Chlorella variabilis]|eukprot:XP_005851200.1 hypothetical protein CHLNCDRAFT_137880 [Chlorella variabilis]